MRRLWLKLLTPQGNVGGFRVRPRARHSPMLLREASGEAQGATTRGGGEGGRISGVSQDEKYAADADGVVYMSGLQALVKLPLLQRERDDEKGIRSAGFISGYRGSPLGAYDQQLWNAQGHLDRAGVKFIPGLNEEIAATSVWGTQQAGVSRDRKVDGVFGIWYGKGPGVDRSTDAMKHANMAGSSQHGGVLCIAGDDHAAKSSTLPHQSELNLRDMNIPCLVPSSVAELITFGLIGLDMSRATGSWVGMKVTSETCDTTASLPLSSLPPPPPSTKAPPPPPLGGLHLRVPDHWNAQEERLYRHKLPAVLSYARRNRINKRTLGAPLGMAKVGIVAAGKPYTDVVEALLEIGLDDRKLSELGVSVYKVGLVWPLEPQGLAEYARGVEELLVYEEKRPLIASQARDILYDAPPDSRPDRIVWGTEAGLKHEGELTVGDAARAISASLSRTLGWTPSGGKGGGGGGGAELVEAAKALGFQRLPFFCAGCPHNTGTTIPVGAHAIGGIGCHTLGTFMGDRGMETFTHMGCEGSNWIGQAPFVETRHAFANMGDGTYVHSGLLSIRACVASGANMTFKILHNGAVAMTGGQRNDTLTNSSPPAMAKQLLGEGVQEVVIVTEDKGLLESPPSMPGLSVEPRKHFQAVQKRLAARGGGTTAIIFDQACATEKRRGRKRGKLPPAPEKVAIHHGVCEGCGDCGLASNCVAVSPLETQLGRKRTIDQSACTQDYSCTKGFCPSFVTAKGRPKPSSSLGLTLELRSVTLPSPPPPPADGGDVLVCGVGGTGVVTVAALLGLAAHGQGVPVTVFDQVGLSQKGGPVASHVRVGGTNGGGVRVRPSRGVTLLACDLVTAVLPPHISSLSSGKARVVSNSSVAMPGSFARQPDMRVPRDEMLGLLAKAAGGVDRVSNVDFTALAREMLGDALMANAVMVGYALQLGVLPVGEDAVRRAIDTLGVSTALNHDAVLLGRIACFDPSLLKSPSPPPENTLPAVLEARAHNLRDYGGASRGATLASRYESLVRRVEEVESRIKMAGESSPGTDAEGAGGGGVVGGELALAAARGYYKVLSYKDEYEVARLMCDGTVERELSKTLEPGSMELTYHLSPPLIAPIDVETGRVGKIRVPGWVAQPLFKLIASMSFLRGTPMDPFGLQQERLEERKAIRLYEDDCEAVLARVDGTNYRHAVEILELPLSVRGFGHVKAEAAARATERRKELMSRFLGEV